MLTKTELGQNHKEKTDTHRILLAVNASEHGARLDVIVTDDADVFVLAITFSKNYHTTFPGVWHYDKNCIIIYMLASTR